MRKNSLLLRVKFITNNKILTIFQNKAFLNINLSLVHKHSLKCISKPYFICGCPSFASSFVIRLLLLPEDKRVVWKTLTKLLGHCWEQYIWYPEDRNNFSEFWHTKWKKKNRNVLLNHWKKKKKFRWEDIIISLGLWVVFCAHQVRPTICFGVVFLILQYWVNFLQHFDTH